VTILARRKGSFRAEARRVLADKRKLEALDLATARLRTDRLRAWDEIDDVDALRERAREARHRAIANLDGNLDRFQRALEARGGRVHRCANAAEATAAITEICRSVDARLVAKAKSMATEEIGLNSSLEAAGMQVVETDLGEYLLQLAGEHPAHIVAPAIGKTAADAARLLESVDGEPVEPGAL